MSSKTVSESVRCDVFVDPCQFVRSPDRSIDGAGREVVATDNARARIAGKTGARKDVVPDPLLIGEWVLSLQGVR
jgi:hypothetical protein